MPKLEHNNFFNSIRAAQRSAEKANELMSQKKHTAAGHELASAARNISIAESFEKDHNPEASSAIIASSKAALELRSAELHLMAEEPARNDGRNFHSKDMLQKAVENLEKFGHTELSGKLSKLLEGFDDRPVEENLKLLKAEIYAK